MKIDSLNLPVEFSDKKVTPYGGMTLVKNFMDKMGFLDLLEDDELPQPQSNRGYNPKHIISGFMLSIWTGASRYIHAEWLKYDSVLMSIFSFDKLPSQSTYSRFFGKFSWKRNETVFAALQRKFFEKYINIDAITVDLDSTVITRYGQQQGAAKGYNPKKPGRNSHHPLMAFIPQIKMVANAWMRPGNTADLSNYKPFLQETFHQVLLNQKISLVRADSGFYADNLLGWLEDNALKYIVVAKLYESIKQQVIASNNWFEFAKGLEYATFSTPSGKSRKVRRYVVVRKHIEIRPHAGGKLLDLFSGAGFKEYRYSCFVTNLDLPGDQIWDMYKSRADAENRIKELKTDFGMENFCLKDFWATEASFRFMMLAYNIMSLFRLMAVRSHKSSTLQTLRFHCFALGAWKASHSGKTVLKIALPTKKRAWMSGIFDQVSGLSPPFQFSNA